MPKDVLIISTDPSDKRLVKSLLNPEDISFQTCADTGEALQLVKDNSFSLVVISPPIEIMQALELKKKIQNLQPDTEVVVLSSFRNIRTSNDVLRYGPSDYILHKDDLRSFILYFRERMRSKAQTELQPDDIKDFFFQLTDLLVSVLEVDDRYFSGNTHTVMRLSRQIAQRMTQDQEIIDAVTLASLLRDIGKIGVKQQVLNETRDLTDKEFDSIRDHCQTSLKLLKRVNLPWRVDQIIAQHHEQYDGKGYPNGLKGREVLLGARILSVSDSYAALTTDRPYRKAMDRGSAVQEIEKNAGNRYDPEVVEIFLEVIREDWEQNAETKERLLVVDDEKYVQTLIKLHMVNEGFEVATAENGAEALKCIKEKKPDLIITDVVMPLMDGYTLCRALAGHAEYRDIPLMFLSAHREPEDRVQGLKLGAVDYVGKPFDLEELSLKINSFLRRDKRSRKIPDREAGIHGRLEDMSVPDVVQILNLGLKTARVEFTHKSEQEPGYVFFSRGEIVCAVTSERQGEDAFFQMLRWMTGTFNIRHGMQPKLINVSKNTMGLLMDGMKIIDEENREHASRSSE